MYANEQVSSCSRNSIPVLKVTRGSVDEAMLESDEISSSDCSKSSSSSATHSDTLVRPPSSSSLPLPPSSPRRRQSGENFSDTGAAHCDGAYDSDSSWVSHVTSVDSETPCHSPDAKQPKDTGNKTAGKAVRHSLKKMQLKLKTKMHFSDMDTFTPETEEVMCDWQQAGATPTCSTPDPPGPETVTPPGAKPKHDKKKKRGSRTKRLYKKALKKSELKAMSEAASFSPFLSDVLEGMDKVLSPSYKQKNEDLHKFFKNLPETERLLVDHTCALVKDILIQGRLYVSQNYICFHSRFLKLQTAIQVPFKEITSLTKEKTVKVIPNAIQIQSVTRGKLTFTSFTARDRAYQQVQKLWHNALQDKPMTPQELWSNIRDQYGNYLGCSSDDDYVKPEKSLNYSLDGDSVEVKRDSFEYSDGAKQKKKKNALQRSTRIPNGDVAKPLILNGRTPSERERLASITDHSTGDDKSSYPGSVDDRDMFEDDDSLPTENGQIPAMECEDSGPCEFAVPCFKRVYLEKTFSVPVDHLFDTIYGQNCPFWKNHLSKEANDITITNWQAGSGAQQEGHQVRVLEYLLLLSNPLGPKSSRVTETQVWYKESEAGQSYGVDCIAQMHGVPYGDYFTTVMRYSMRKVTKSTSELRVSADIRFNKTPWGLVKNFIEKNAYSGIDDNFTKLGPELEEYFEAQKQHRSRQPSLSEPSLRTFPRQRLSVSASGDRKRNSSTNEDPNEQTTAKHIPNGEVHSATSGEGVIAAPTVTPLALPSRDYNNNSSSHHVTKPVGEESFGRRWRNRALVFVLALLLFSNYSMYQRLSTLEEIQSSKVAVDLSNLPPNQQPNSVFEVTDPSDLTSSDRIKLLERRLSRLESVVTDHVSASGERWRHMEENWRALDRKIDAILSKLDRDTKT